MTWVKICGTTNLEDALTAVEAGADAVGFVFYEKSPRNISVEAVREIVGKLPEGVEKIGVFVNDGELEPNDVLLQAGLTGTQTYMVGQDNARRGGGKEIGVSCLPKHPRFLMAVPMNLVGEDAEQIQHFASDFARWGKNLPEEGASLLERLRDMFGYVLDSGDLRQPGGTGKTFDWEKAVPIAEGMRQGGVKLVVAGGLTPENVGEAMKVLSPWGVDVVSGVEARPGKKDPEKVRAFVRAVREMDGKTG
ncbi:MAG: phosphoribosylanthranilate isomerase [Candidatus Sulfotelmatobacter sp.]